MVPGDTVRGERVEEKERAVQPGGIAESYLHLASTRAEVMVQWIPLKGE